MKKRVLSLVMALTLCLSTLPTAALAEEARAAASKDAGREAVYTVDGDAAAPEGGIALLNAGTIVASVTIGNVTTGYSDIFAAFDAVNYKYVNAAITLLDDVELPDQNGFPGRIRFASNGTSTLDLAGHTITHADTGYTDYWLAFDGVTFGEEDTILTLSTCCRKYDMENTGNMRLVVMAKLLPEGAAAQDFTVRSVSDPEMP